MPTRLRIRAHGSTLDIAFNGDDIQVDLDGDDIEWEAEADNINLDINGDDESTEADPTPPHGITRVKKPYVTSVDCPFCGAARGKFCTSVSSGKSWGAYDNGHAARRRARDAAWKAQA